MSSFLSLSRFPLVLGDSTVVISSCPHIWRMRQSRSQPRWAKKKLDTTASLKGKIEMKLAPSLRLAFMVTAPQTNRRPSFPNLLWYSWQCKVSPLAIPAIPDSMRFP